MPLDTSRMYHKGPLLFGDVKQYADLLTGTMTDQPVSIGNNLSVTGNVLASGALKTGTKAGVPVDGDVSSPADGMLRIDTTNNNLYFRSNGQWRLTAGGSAAITTFEATNVTGATVTLPSLPANNGVFEVSVNGQAQQATRDWTISGQVITFTTALSADDVHVAYVTASTFNTSNYFAHHEVTLAAGQSTITLPQTPVGAPSVTRGGVQQYNTAGHYSLAGAVITLALPIGAAEDGRISVDYFVAGGGASDAGSVNGIQVGTPPTPNVLVKTDGAGLLPVAAIPPITSAMITDGTIATADLANASVTNIKLASDTARANLLTNGGFEVWQRGTSLSPAGGGFTVDRWAIFNSAGTGAVTVSRDTLVPAGSGSNYSAKLAVTSLPSGFFYLRHELSIPADGHQLKGRTLSVGVDLYSDVINNCDIRFFSNGTGASDVKSTKNTATNTWQRHTATITVPNDANRVYLDIEVNAVSNVYVDNAMLVVGSVPADYAPLHPADDLARCLRYYQRVNVITVDTNVAVLQCGSATSAYGMLWLPVSMAVDPTLTFSPTADWGLWQANTARVALNSGPTIYRTGRQSIGISAGVASGLVAGNMTNLVGNAGAWFSLEANP